ncbi:MAG: glycoside hydrolase family 43 protein [Niabella sp.]|nr:glycoside hydrolase family 43 protein [Niabella sp.]
MTRFFLLAVLLLSAGAYQVRAQQTFTNPLLPYGADPYSFYKDGYYYYTHTTGSKLVLWKTKTLADLKDAEQKTVWTPPPNTSWSKELWAPEILYLRGKWYLYFAADDGHNRNHRMYVLENSAADPMKGEWVFKGKVAAPGDKWAIDGDVLEYKKQLYMIWSGWADNKNGQQNIYIAKMSNPWTIDGERVLISQPEYDWERHGHLKGETPEEVHVNEGPQFLVHGSRIFIVYSASGCWTDFYCLGMLAAKNDKDLLTPANWIKSKEPVFKAAPEKGVFAPGHNSFFKSPDGKEDWILYHANAAPGQGCGGHRSPRAQRFNWNKDGTPDFGEPVAAGEPLPEPASKK